QPVASLDGGTPGPIDPGAPWGSVLRPVRVVEDGVLTELTVFGRCGDVAERVWNAEVGYPGDGRYREFHKQHGLRGHRYWRVTDRRADLADKQPYDPAAAREAVYTHGDHFASMIRERLRPSGGV